MKIYVNDIVAKKLFPEGGRRKPLEDVFETLNSPDFKAVAARLGLEEKDWGMVFRLVVFQVNNQAGLVSSQPPNTEKEEEKGYEIDIDLLD